MAGGLPISAVLLGQRVGALPPPAHVTTFGGNPLACAAVLATIRCLEAEGLPQRAAALGERILAGLRAMVGGSQLVREVRGLGLMAGVELKVPSGPVLAALAGRSALALTAGANVMRFLPPLVIEESEIDLLPPRRSSSWVTRTPCQGSFPCESRAAGYTAAAPWTPRGPWPPFFLAAARVAPRLRNVRLTVVGAVEEESHGRGARHLAATRPAPECATIGEPSAWEGVTLGYKGLLVFDYRRRPPGAHSASEVMGPAEKAVAL